MLYVHHSATCADFCTSRTLVRWKKHEQLGGLRVASYTTRSCLVIPSTISQPSCFNVDALTTASNLGGSQVQYENERCLTVCPLFTATDSATPAFHRLPVPSRLAAKSILQKPTFPQRTCSSVLERSTGLSELRRRDESKIRDKSCFPLITELGDPSRNIELHEAIR